MNMILIIMAGMSLGTFVLMQPLRPRLGREKSCSSLKLVTVQRPLTRDSLEHCQCASPVQTVTRRAGPDTQAQATNLRLGSACALESRDSARASGCQLSARRHCGRRVQRDVT